jgi:GH25 family lysozyme M1 (1,4-beta-N-acetylmuramidase)
MASATSFNRAQAYGPDRWREIQAIIGAGVDGDPGKETAARLKDWQRSAGQKPDGKCGAGTYESLFPAAPRAPYHLDELAAAYPGIWGVDISHHQDDEDRRDDDIDWPVLAIDARFVIIKSSEGRTYVDPQWAHFYDEAGGADVPRGCYHYALPVWKGRVTDPKGNASGLARATEGRPLELPAFLDLETRHVRELVEEVGAAAALRWVDACLGEADRLTGKTTGVYLSRWGADQLAAREPSQWAGRALWWAYYNPHAGAPVMAEGWTRWDVWQVTDKGSTPGIEGGVDVTKIHPASPLAARLGA